MSRAILTVLLSLTLLLPATRGFGDDDTPASSSQLEVSGFSLAEGFFDFYWDPEEGKVWLSLEEFDQPFLYVSSLATGLGSNPVGLDRGQLGSSRIVRFKKVGRRVFLVQENLSYRASSTNAAERRAIQESFAESILWAGALKMSSAGAEVVDISDLLLRDAHDCIGTLAAAGQGSFSLDRDRSYVHLPRTKAFPRNTEFEVALTFQSSKPGRLANRVAADGKSITLRQHHSFVRLPDDGYRPRKFDPRVGCFAVTYADYSVPIDRPLEQKLITRHRLEKRDPQAASSPPKQPIVYYVDSGVPQPVRDALLDGARWWNSAFEAAGFQDAFQVKVLPEGVDPMDVRYNVIQWVHRATRGWSYGQSVVDPRTGEIIKGHVLLGSLRVRQDHLLVEGLTQLPGNNGVQAASCGMGYVPQEAALAQLDPRVTSLSVALARIRQLSAHEVGHTLGFAHNFAASTYGDRASVMDYPAPRTKITDGKIDLSDAYGVGVGDWDKFTVKYAYMQFSPEQEETELARLVSDAVSQGMLYVTDADARPAGAAHPLGNLWDNGTDPVAALQHELAVRRIALEDFDGSALSVGQPLAELEKMFVPVYLHHRYQVDAVAKMLGGYHYTYAVVGDGQTPQAAIPADRQQQALSVLLETLQPKQLVIPRRILDAIPPKIASSASDRERFGSQTSPIFDPATAMRAAAELTLGNLFQPQRASRLARHEDEKWGLLEVIDQTFESLVNSRAPRSVEELEARRIVQQVFTERLIALAGNDSASHDARAIADYRLRRLNSTFRQFFGQTSDDIDRAHWLALTETIKRFLDRSAPAVTPASPTELPPGSPIGAAPR